MDSNEKAILEEAREMSTEAQMPLDLVFMLLILRELRNIAAGPNQVAGASS